MLLRKPFCSQVLEALQFTSSHTVHIYHHSEPAKDCLQACENPGTPEGHPQGQGKFGKGQIRTGPHAWQRPESQGRG